MANVTIPDAYREKVDRLRRFLSDERTLNRLLNAEESSDDYLYECIEDALDEINVFGYAMGVPWTIETFPYWSILKSGAVLQVLIGKGILSARNTLTYNDTGGVTVQDFDTYGRYINFFNLLINKYRNMVMSLKRSNNVDSAYGGVYSEYANFSGASDDNWSW